MDFIRGRAMQLKDYKGIKMAALVILRFLIGWHFLYEGLSKLLNPYRSSASYLSESKGFFSGLFIWILESPERLKVVDFLNIWGLTAIGAGLIAGFLTRASGISGLVLLLLYYVCNPPFIGFTYSAPAEGNYLIVNKILIEMAALLVLTVFPSGKTLGLDALIFYRKQNG